MSAPVAPPEVEPLAVAEPAPVSAKPPMVCIRPPRAWEALDLSGLWRFRDLLLALAVRDIKLRYRQTVLGVLWVILQPLLGAGIFAFVFGRVARLDSGGQPYVLFAYAGLLAWNLFNGVVLKASGSLVANAPLVSKVFFPRLLLPFSGVISALLDFGIALVVGEILLLISGQPPTVSLLMAPLWLFFLLLLATGVGLLCAALAVAYRDVNHILPVALQFLLYGSPVGYTIAIIPAGLPRLLYKLNPLAPFIEGFRVSLLGHGLIGVRSSTYACFMAVVIFLAGLIVFRRMERQFADVI
ncbi:lipopolysaccharide transport system permease protein [Chthoniobacter flavus]|uniref:ABC transporter permease n=1 Tax=Chthoniobacter flavus TaxID=191863 RepID=UPI00104914D2|nr:ABC transporter permease [Chthoniobacter flavus]TCO92841.1 lipopolysaccharide transport system permease protein [Chthoniobacter flavus]